MNTSLFAGRASACSVWSAVASMLAAHVGIITPLAHAVSYELVTVGDLGNANDPATGNVYGGVAYEYRIGKYEVTIGQYADFLNAVAAIDTYSLYNPAMATDLWVAGIQRNGSSGSYTYSVVGPSGATPAGADSPPNRPIGYLTWYDAARFANWMANGQPSGVQGPTTTENGAYDLNGRTSGPVPGRNPLNPNTGFAPVFTLPTESEWYKAAYYKGGSALAGYWTYATQSDSPPGNLIGNLPNQANYVTGAGLSVTQSSTISYSQNYLTNVGAYTNSGSFYGTFDQSGNLWEWNESPSLRGGTFGSMYFNISRYGRLGEYPPGEENHYDFGFRLTSVPEPSTYAMALAGLVFGGYSKWRRRPPCTMR